MINTIAGALKKLDYEAIVELAGDLNNGDLTTNVALQYAKEKGVTPRELAEEIVGQLGEIEGVQKIEVAGPGFINFWFQDELLITNLRKVLEDSNFGKCDLYDGQKIVIEHSSPNLFKPFHIGHVMNNAIGEALVRMFQNTNAEVVRISYPSDVSLGIAKAVWSLMDKGVESLQSMMTLQERLDFLGKCYVDGTKAYEDDESVQKIVRVITTKIYEHEAGPELDAYELGKNITLQYFKDITQSLGSEFDELIFESEAAVIGKKIVEENMGKVFTSSDGAVVYEGEQDGLHTRVFINSAGYPTYEAKDIGLIDIKFNTYHPDLSIVVTDREQSQYFKVMLSAAGKINPEWQEKTTHITHGRMTLRGAKMSSRLGGVPTAEELLDILAEEINEVSNNELVQPDVQKIAVGALKFSILRNAPGNNINFDPDTSLSFEGDSGPYLQYSIVRIGSIDEKAGAENIFPKLSTLQSEDFALARQLIKFSTVVQQATVDLAPQQILHYALEVAQAMNSYYGANKVIDTSNVALSAHRLALLLAGKKVLEKSLDLLGVPQPSKM